MTGEPPTIHDHAGGREAFTRWLNRFYDLVEQEPLLAPSFGGTVSAEHREHAIDWWCEVMGGATVYTDQRGGYENMLSHHLKLGITREMRLRFVTLLSQAADDVALPDDPELRAALMGYAEWGSRLAVENSAADAAPFEHAPVPRWGWGVAPPFDPNA